MAISNKDKQIFDHWSYAHLMASQTYGPTTDSLATAKLRASRIRDGFVLSEATYYSQLLTELFKHV